MLKKIGLMVLLSLLAGKKLYAISMVYNFRIAQITKQPIYDDNVTRKYSPLGLIFDQWQQKHDGPIQNFAGGLTAFIYNFNPYYFRTDFAVSYIHEKIGSKTTFSCTETDDILLSLGRNFNIIKRADITLTGLLGIPTHDIVSLRHVGFGYSQIGMGLQVDGIYQSGRAGDLLYGARYIYFIPRNARDLIDNNHRFTIGNIADILLAYKKNWSRHGFECGYTRRWQFGARIRPLLPDIVEKTNYSRNNFYAVYKYKFLINQVANRLLFNIAYGFDSAPKLFGNKNIITVWGAWRVHF